MVISNHFLCKDLVHHPIDSQPFISMVGLGVPGIQHGTLIFFVFLKSTNSMASFVLKIRPTKDPTFFLGFQGQDLMG